MIVILCYLLAIIAANFSAFFFGPIVTPLNSFLFIGLDLALRDRLHEKWAGNSLVKKMGGIILLGSLLSFLLNPATGAIALASCIAFGLAAIGDTFIYNKLIKQHFLVKSNGSNVVGAAIDSIAFPTIAFGELIPLIILGQFLAKVFGGVVWSSIVYRFNKK